MIALLAVRKWFSAIPSWVFAGVAVFTLGYYLAFIRQQKKFEAYKTEQAAVIQKWKAKAETISSKTVTQYVDRIQVVHQKGESIITKVPVYVPRNVCVLPPGFRSVLDAAATGSDLPDPAGVTDASPKDPSAAPRELY